MKSIHWVLFTILMLPVALLTCGSVFAEQVQASFTVSVTLQTPAKAVAGSQLCANGKTVNPFGAAARVDCPVVAEGKNTPTSKEAPSNTPANTSRQPQVMVSF